MSHILLPILLLFTVVSCTEKASKNQGQNRSKLSVTPPLPGTPRSNTSNNISGIDIDTISRSEFTELRRLSAPDFLDTLNLKGFKQSGHIRIVDPSGRIVKHYSDSLENGDDTEQRSYTVSGTFTPIQSMLISAVYYESGEYLLINTTTGKETKLIGYPKLSADHKFLFCSSIALGYDAMPTGFQIWGINASKKLILLHESRTPSWGISDFYWVESRSLILEAKNMEGQRYFLKLTF